MTVRRPVSLLAATTNDVVVIALACVVMSVAAIEAAAPFAGVVHTWWSALAVSGAGAYLLVSAVPAIAPSPQKRPIALVGLGGALLAACVAFAAFLVGQPERVPAAPVQAYRPPH